MVPFPKHVTPAHCEAMGRVVVAWAIVESSMLVALQALLGIDQPKTIVAFWHAGYSDRRDRIGSLITLGMEKNPESERITTAWKNLVTELNAGHSLRNIVAHSRWYVGTEEGAITPFQVTARGKLHVSDLDEPEKQWTSCQLEVEATKLLEVAASFRAFFAENFAARFGGRDEH